MNSNELWRDILTLKVLFVSYLMWATSMPIVVFSGLSFLEFDCMYATDRQTVVRHA